MMDDVSAAIRCHTVMAATNKCLAQSNKSRTGGKATKKRRSLPAARRNFVPLAKLVNGKIR